MAKRPVVNNLSRHILIDLHTQQKVTKQKQQNYAAIERNWIEIQQKEEKDRTFWPLGMYLIATSSFVSLFRSNLATPKFPDPRSFTISYLSIFFLANRSQITRTPTTKTSFFPTEDQAAAASKSSFEASELMKDPNQRKESK